MFWSPSRGSALEPASFRDRSQDALRELVEAKAEGLATTPSPIARPPKVINLVELLKRSLVQDAEPQPKKSAVSKPARAKAVPDRRPAATPILRSREDRRSWRGAGAINRAKATEEGRT